MNGLRSSSCREIGRCRPLLKMLAILLMADLSRSRDPLFIGLRTILPHRRLKTRPLYPIFACFSFLAPQRAFSRYNQTPKERPMRREVVRALSAGIVAT